MNKSSGSYLWSVVLDGKSPTDGQRKRTRPSASQGMGSRCLFSVGKGFKEGLCRQFGLFTGRGTSLLFSACLPSLAVATVP